MAKSRILLLLFAPLFCSQAQADPWRYVADSTAPEFTRPQFRTVALSPEKPELTELVEYRGVPKYAMFRYGTPGSLRMAVVIDEVDAGDFDVYVDANRDRTITNGERIAGTGRLRTCELLTALDQNGKTEFVPRQVAIRRGFASKSIGFATVGFHEGQVAIGQDRFAARRVDGDGDGLFSSGRDRIWIDLNADGKWNGFAEQFPYLPILNLMGQRYAVRGDFSGRRLEFESISGTGRVRLAANMHDPAASITDLNVMLVGEDGSAVSLQGADESIDVPVGKYSIHTLRFALKDTKSGTPWSFVFSDAGDRKTRRTFDVGLNSDMSIDPVGELKFELHRNDKQPVVSGSSLQIQPKLYTADGLLINSSVRGSTKASYGTGHAANIVVHSSSGQPLGVTQSGFA